MYMFLYLIEMQIVEQTWTPVGNLLDARLGTVSSPSSLLTMVQGSVGRLLVGTCTPHMGHCGLVL